MPIPKKGVLQKVDVVASSLELAAFYKTDPGAIDKADLIKGGELVGIFSDDSFRGSFKDFNKMKVEAIKMAIDDLSRGAMTLKTSSIGLTFSNGKFQIYILPFGSNPQGTVSFSITLKNVKAFLKWRKGETVEIEQDDLNSAIYRLTVAMSEVLA